MPAENMSGGRARAPLLRFLLFAAVLVAALLIQAPGWGLMDDAQNLEIAARIHGAAHPAAEWWRTVRWDLNHIGTFRPGYYLWIALAYSLFAAAPLALYVLMALLNLAVLVGWGHFAVRVFRVPTPHRELVRFGLPPLFFLFTPLWNVFMYVSLQEKFVLLFGLLSALFLAAFFRHGRFGHFLLALVAVLAGLATKSTMTYLALAYAGFALADLVLLGRSRRRSALVLIVYTALLAGFYVFISGHLGIYTGRYGQRLQPSVLVNQFLLAPRAVQLLCLLSLSAFVWMIHTLRRGTCAWEPFALIVPLALPAYVAVILPWGFPNYILSPLAPWVLILAVPVWLIVLERRPRAGRWLNQAATGAVALLLVLVIWPRIERMADSRRLLDSVRSLSSRPARFFLPPPYMEPADAIRRFTGVRVKFLADGILEKRRLVSGDASFLIFGRDFPALRLEEVRPGAEVHANSTWKIFRLEPAPGQRRDFRPRFGAGLFERLSRPFR
jgi:hypothetical protein